MTRARVVPAVACAAMAATVVVGMWLARHDGRELGVPYPPFIGRWDPAATAWALVAAGLLAVAIWAAPRALAVPPAAFALAVYAFTLALRLALGASSRGADEWSRVFDPGSFEGPNEYLPALTALQYGTGFVLDRFAELVPALPVHAAGHPPGLLLVMDAFGLTTPGRLAALCIAGGALAAPLAYAVGRELLDDRRARYAALLTATAPSVLLFATSADALYASIGLLAAWPLAASLRAAAHAVSPVAAAHGALSAAASHVGALRRTTSLRPAALAGGAVLLAFASLFAWSLLAIGAWAALLALRRDGVRAMLVLGATCAVAVLLVHGALAVLTGWDPIGTLQATERVYRFGIAAERPYWFWLPGSPTAFLLMLGLPVAWLAVRALAQGDDAAIAILAVLAIAALAGFTKAEVERICLSFAPLVCLAAASVLQERHLRPVLAILGAQALAWELLWNTVW
jgi:methylthioxylose transferase